jgi:hypothetical protein
MVVVLGAVALGFGQTNDGLAGALAMRVASFVAMVGVAVIMLPAMNRLVPRG